MTVKEVSRLTGVSIRALQYYDRIGLLHPAGYTEAGYRLYDDRALERLQQILLFRQLEFPLKEIGRILSSPDFDRNKALEQQITLLTMRKEHLEKLIGFARGIQAKGERTMDFSVFDTGEIDEYTKKAKAQWGKTAPFREFEQKSQTRTKEETQEVMRGFQEIFVRFGELKEETPASENAKKQVRKLQEYLTENFYRCTDEILLDLGSMYVSDGAFTANIDRLGGEGTAAFVAEAVRIYCGERGQKMQ